MKKLDYYKLAIKAGKYMKKSWVVSAFSIADTKTDPQVMSEFDVVRTQTGIFFVKEDKTLEKIEDASIKEPLFRFLDPIDVDYSWVPNAPTQPTRTTYGNVLFNMCCIVYSFGRALDFVFGQINIGKIEDQISKRLVDDSVVLKPGDPGIPVKHYVKFVNSLQYILGLSQLCVVSATPKNIQIAPGFETYKKELIKKYGDKLHDPTQYVEFEKELKAYDDEYLKGDPSTRAFLTGKVRNISRKKLYLTIGTGQGFEEGKQTDPVVNSLHEGWPIHDKDQMTSMMNLPRFGSFSRGNETMRGGVAAKILLRSASNFKIKKTDCQTPFGISRIYREHDVENLVGRYVILGKENKLISSLDDAKKYIGQPISVRSPMYCRLKGDALCEICAGEKLSQSPNGLTIALTEVSSIILTTSLKAFHGKVLSSQELMLDEVLS